MAVCVVENASSYFKRLHAVVHERMLEVDKRECLKRAMSEWCGGSFEGMSWICFQCGIASLGGVDTCLAGWLLES